MGYDDVIPRIYGTYQQMIYVLLCFPAIICAFHKLGNVFLIAEPKSRCQLPIEFPNASYELNQTEISKWYPYNATEKVISLCTIKVPDSNITESCTEYIYDNSTYGYTAVIEWNLTCNRAFLIAVGNSLFMFGVMVGSIGFGELSDRWSRKKTFFLSLVVQLVFGIIASVAPEFWSFTIARAVVGATTSGVFLVAYVIGLEMVPPSHRLLAGTVCQIFFSFGYILTGVLALLMTNWREFQLVLTIPGALFLSYWWLIPESTRWLINKGKISEAKKNIHYAAKYNKLNISDKSLDQLLLGNTEEPCKVETGKGHDSIFKVFAYPNLRKRSLIIFFDWFANNITYYGLSWNTNNLSGNPYVNFLLSGAVEIPAYIFLLLTLNKWGRKNVMCCCMIGAGAALLLTMAVPNDMEWLTVTLAMLGKFAITSSYGAVYIFSTEQFPTVVRNAGLGMGSTCARIGSLNAPYVNIAAHIWQPLPLLIFGSLALIGGVMSLWLPETLNKKLPETFEEGEAFGKKPKSGKVPTEAKPEAVKENDKAESTLLNEDSENGKV